MKPFAILALMFASVAICQQDSFEVKELSSQEQAALGVLRANADAASAVLAKAREESIAAWTIMRAKEAEISATFHPEKTTCYSGKRHVRSVVIRGKYALISEQEEPCGNLSGGGIIFGDAQ